MRPSRYPRQGTDAAPPARASSLTQEKGGRLSGCRAPVGAPSSTRWHGVARAACALGSLALIASCGPVESDSEGETWQMDEVEEGWSAPAHGPAARSIVEPEVHVDAPPATNPIPFTPTHATSLPPLPKRYIVVLDDQQLQAAHVRNPADVAQGHGLATSAVYRHSLRGFSAHISDLKLGTLRHDPLVKYVQPDYPMTKVAPQHLPFGRNRVDAELSRVAKIDRQDSGGDRVDIDVAIIDTGIDLGHIDLNVAGGEDFVLINKVSRDGISSPNGGQDLDGHGTHCGGIVAALDDGLDTGNAGFERAIMGVAPGARLWAVRVLDANGGGYASEIIDGIDWITGCVTGSDPGCPAGASGIRVANMSLGCQCGTSGCWCPGTDNDAMRASIDAATTAGVTFVVAAGNSSMNVGTQSSCGFSPACFDSVITVSALTDFDGRRGGLAAPGDCEYETYTDDTLAGFSNYGSQVDLMAPGVCIDSTILHSDTGYCTHCGSSFACPSGKTLCRLEQNPGRYTCCSNAGCKSGCETIYCPSWRDTICQGGSPTTSYWCCYIDHDFADMSGTSMASPHVAGGAALYMAEYEQNHGAYPTPAQVRTALTTAGDPAPCGGGSGSSCGSGEPALFVGEHRDSVEVAGYAADFMFQNGAGSAGVTTAYASDGARSLNVWVHDQDPGTHGYSCVQFCLMDGPDAEPLDDYLHARLWMRFDDLTDWTGFGVGGPNSGTDEWLYWWWIASDGAVFDEVDRFGGSPVFQTGSFHSVDITIDRRDANPANHAATLEVDGVPESPIPLSTWETSTTDMKCVFVMSGVQDDTYQDLYVDGVFVRARPDGQY